MCNVHDVKLFIVYPSLFQCQAQSVFLVVKDLVLCTVCLLLLFICVHLFWCSSDDNGLVIAFVCVHGFL